jgi:hypothetical protein
MKLTRDTIMLVFNVIFPVLRVLYRTLGGKGSRKNKRKPQEPSNESLQGGEQDQS